MAVLRPLKAHCQNAGVTPQHVIPGENSPQQEQGDMAAAQVNKVSWVRGCVCFSS